MRTQWAGQLLAPGALGNSLGQPRHYEFSSSPMADGQAVWRGDILTGHGRCAQRINCEARRVSFSSRSYEGERAWPTDGRKHKHPIQEAAEAERRLVSRAAEKFDEFQILRFRATNVAPFPFEWLDLDQTAKEYAALLLRLSREYDRRFP